jgi:hypothetical protein
MERKKKSSETRKKIIEAYEENEYANVLQNRNRARSFTVGTAFGGAIEVSLRGDHSNLWCILQPVEVIEMMEQLAAAVGVQIAMRPKNDFSTWRGWDDTMVENKYWIGTQREQYRLEAKEEEEDKDKTNLNVSNLLDDINEEALTYVEELVRDSMKMQKDIMEEVKENSKEISREQIINIIESKILSLKNEGEAANDLYKFRKKVTDEFQKDLNKDVEEYCEENGLD